MNQELLVWPLFSTPVACTILDVDTDEVLKFISSLNYQQYSEKNGYHTKGISVLNHPELSSLKEEIDKNMQDFITKVLKIKVPDNGEYYLHKSWVNLHKSGDFAQQHLHKNSMYSFVFYVDANKNSGDIFFTKTNTMGGCGFDAYDIEFHDHDLLNADDWFVTPQPGMLLMFPSNTYHGTKVNTSNDDRYSIAGNYFLRGTIGTDYTSYLTFN